MHRFFYSTKDAWINEHTASQNYGKDQILELKKQFDGATEKLKGTSRILLQFDINAISQSRYLGEIPANAVYNLRLTSTEAHSLPDEYILTANAISESWVEGTGRLSDNPVTSNGVTWESRDATYESSMDWNAAANRVSSGSRVFGSGSESNGSGSQGGSAYFKGSGYDASQTFSYQSADVNMDVSNIVRKWISGSNASYPNGIPNNGMVLRISGSHADGTGMENDTKKRFDIKFFSRDTHTIYVPKLEVKWDDSVWNTGSLTALDVTGATDNVVYVRGLKERYTDNETVKFRIGSRARYVAKTVSTSIQTATGSYIARGSGSYSIVDMATGEVMVPFGNYSKLSCDSTSNYFLQDLNTFPVNRFYKILLKVKHNDSQEVIYDDGYEFAVVD